jgi:WS/DGAT/MGAT family acyltransferase
MPARQKISAVDTAWLRMDRPSNLMMICGVLIFRERLSYARLKRAVEDRFLQFKRFRQHPVQTAAGAFWEDAGDFELEHHVVHVALPGKGGKRELQTLASRLAGTPLLPTRPLWQFHLVDNFDGGSAVVVRIHHCYADGIALVQVMLSMTDASAHGPPALPAPAPRKERKPRSAAADDSIAQMMQPLTGAVQMAMRVGTMLVEKGVELWQDPAKAMALAEQGGALTTEIARLALMQADSPTRFKGKPGVGKRVAWAPPLALTEVKAVGRALGASVNDVLLSCAAGAMRGYLESRGDDVDGLMVRSLVPVNLRPLERAYDLGNQFGIVFLDLPIGIENPVERLYAVRANMSALKGSLQPVLTLGLLAAAGSGPKMLQEQLIQILARNATAVMTNVPGPQQPLWLGGAKIESMMFWVPQSGDIGMGASIISYDGRVQFGLITDRGLCPDPERVVARFGGEFEQLVFTALLAPPWTGDLDPAVAEAVATSGSGRI